MNKSEQAILDNEVWKAVVNAEPAAFYSLKQEQDSLWLDNLWVLPGSMGQGIGSQLFAHALEKSRARGAAFLKIEADPNAQGFYEKMGMYKVGEHLSQVDDQPRILPVLEIDL